MVNHFESHFKDLQDTIIIKFLFDEVIISFKTSKLQYVTVLLLVLIS